MRLLHVESFEIEKFHEHDLPPYIIASHRWAQHETCFKDVQKKRNVHSTGYKKVESFTQYVKRNIPAVKWLWIDTCCINQRDAAELSEAINSMFRWYQNAELCLAYLADVSHGQGHDDFGNSQWFKRGWTLQELLAPKVVIFLDNSWSVIGNKGATEHHNTMTTVGTSLEIKLSKITGIPEPVLHRYEFSQDLPVENRLGWMDGRDISREEDTSYALYGIFNITLGANYGERRQGARDRLLSAIYRQDDLKSHEADRMRNIRAWLSSPDMTAAHESARQRATPGTGIWLLDSSGYRNWKMGLHRHYWLHGKAGSGKTILCSTVIEDISREYSSETGSGVAFFYLSFAVTQTQTYETFLRSTLTQLGKQTPGSNILQKAYNTSFQHGLSASEMENLLLCIIGTLDRAVILLDALDECTDAGDARHILLSGIERLTQRAPKLRIFVTSRDLPDIRDLMIALGAHIDYMLASRVDEDVRKYVMAELSNDRRLSYLPDSIKISIEDTVCNQADGMFHWAYCQLGNMKRLKSHRAKYIEQALHNIPATLDETYRRMLAGIETIYRVEATTLLRWLAYARSPLNVAELAEIVDVDVPFQNTTREEEGLDIDGPLNILSGLVMAETDGACETQSEAMAVSASQSNGRRMSYFTRNQHIHPETLVYFAHFSVKEYLESDRILNNESTKEFHLIESREHKTLADSCLNYITRYSRSETKTSTRRDLDEFPLLSYACRSWFYHYNLQCSEDISTQVSFLSSDEILRDWLNIYRPDRPELPPFSAQNVRVSGLYYASLLGLDKVAQKLIENGSDIKADHGHYGTALQAASWNGHLKIVKLLLKNGADVNQKSGRMGTALQAAAYRGHENVLEILLDAGAFVSCVDCEPWHYGNALQAASKQGHLHTVQRLLKAGAPVNAQSGLYSNALQAAASRGHQAVVETLLQAGASVKAFGGHYQTPSLAAEFHGHVRIVEILANASVDDNEVHQVLWQDKLDPITGKDGLGRSLLHLAAANNSVKGVMRALENGCRIDDVDHHDWTALHWAGYFGRVDVVKLLLRRNAKAGLQDWQGWTPYQVATFSGQFDIADILAKVRIVDGACEPTTRSSNIFDGFCDGCGHVLIGEYRQCVECTCPPGYDLCFRCSRDANSVHPKHRFDSGSRYQHLGVVSFEK